MDIAFENIFFCDSMCLFIGKLADEGTKQILRNIGPCLDPPLTICMYKKCVIYWHSWKLTKKSFWLPAYWSDIFRCTWFEHDQADIFLHNKNYCKSLNIHKHSVNNNGRIYNFLVIIKGSLKKAWINIILRIWKNSQLFVIAFAFSSFGSGCFWEKCTE